MSIALFCPHCLAAVVPLLRPVGLKTAFDAMADMRTQQREARSTCPVCRQEIVAQAVYNERGQFVDLLSVSGYQTIQSTCTRCRHVGRKRVVIGSLPLPPTGGDFEWLELTTDQCYCPICDHAFCATLKIIPGRSEVELHSVIPDPDWWATQYALVKVSYARGEVYTQEAVRTFLTRDELEAFWDFHHLEFEQMARHPEYYEWQRLLCRNGAFL